jgi:gamma-glutamyltranspeptidase/glutathione hydrolase
MVVSGHSAATLAGIEVLKRGGHAVDALIAASAALAVVIPHATSIGGDCFLLFHDSKSDDLLGLNASGVAPSGATPERFAGGIPAHGPLAPVVPGLVRAWETMHRRFGRIPWRELFTAAIELAEGHTVSQVLATRIPEMSRPLMADPGCAALYLPGGRPVAVGDALRQPALAATLRAVAEQGADSFFRGDTARRIGAFFESNGGLIRAADLAAYETAWVTPVSASYRGYRVSVMPPNSYGVLLLMQLNGLSAVDGATLTADTGRRLAYQMNAMKAAFAAGVPSIADPREAEGEVDRLLGPEATAKMQAAVRGVAPAGRVADRAGTSCLLIADRDGNAISMVQSVFNVFGSCCRDPETGILFNNRLQGFRHTPGHANSIAPGKRPAHTLCPVMVHRDGRVRFVLASPGGLSQTLTNVQVLTNLIDSGMDVAAAVEAPRWCNTRSGDFRIEQEFPERLVAELQQLGHAATRADDSYFYGSAKAIEILPSGNLAGAADHRREAFALGF